MMKTTTWPTSPDRGCAERHKKINEALDNPHRKSLPPREGEEKEICSAFKTRMALLRTSLRPILDRPRHGIFIIGVKRRIHLLAVDENHLDVLRIRNIFRRIAAHDEKVGDFALLDAAVLFLSAPRLRHVDARGLNRLQR